MTTLNYVIRELDKYYYDVDYNTVDEAYKAAQKEAFKCRKDYGIYKLVSSAIISSQNRDEIVSRLDA